MAAQYDLFGGCEEPPAPKPKIDKVKRKEETQIWRKKNKCGEYFVVTAGMFVVGVIFPEVGLRADISAEIKEVAKNL